MFALSGLFSSFVTYDKDKSYNLNAPNKYTNQVKCCSSEVYISNSLKMFCLTLILLNFNLTSRYKKCVFYIKIYRRQNKYSIGKTTEERENLN